MVQAFATNLEAHDGWICGPFRIPEQLLAEQDYIGHPSVHDDATARRAGFAGGTIEGPTHFSALEPLGVKFWGERWFERGCISVRYRSPAYSGDETRACARRVDDTTAVVEIRKSDRALVLEGEISSPAARPSLLDLRLASLDQSAAAGCLSGISVGDRLPRSPTMMDFEGPNGPMYPFSLRLKLNSITEPSAWFDSVDRSPWNRPILPFEMISVLIQKGYATHSFPLAGHPIALFADQEIRLMDGPVYPNMPYEVEREVVAITDTRRSKCLWVRSVLYREGEDAPVASMLLNTAHVIAAAEG